MKNLMDLHCHTISCGHAYSTLGENIREAVHKGLKVYGMSEHGYGAIKSLKKLFFLNQKVIPDFVDGVRILKGIEANIIDYNGTLIEEEVLEHLDYTIASLHRLCIIPGSSYENTSAIIGAIRNPHVKIIGHMDDDIYPVSYKEIVSNAKEYHVAFEVNNASLQPWSFRFGCKENYRKLLEECAKQEVPIIMSSDAHFYTAVGDIGLVEEMVSEFEFPEELILNYSVEKLEALLGLKLQ